MTAAVATLHGEIPNAVVRQAKMELTAREPLTDEIRAGVERARAAAPGRVDFTFAHAQILISQRSYVAARTVLRTLLTSDNTPDVRSSAESFLKYVDQLETVAARRPTMPATGAPRPSASAGATPGAASEALSDAAPPGMPLYRQVKDGEQRVEGTLVRIECTPALITFHLTLPDGAARLTATRMHDVEFITYRDNQTGRVTCGPITPAVPVYVTTGPAAAGGKRQVVAVEYLPAPRESLARLGVYPRHVRKPHGNKNNFVILVAVRRTA